MVDFRNSFPVLAIIALLALTILIVPPGLVAAEKDDNFTVQEIPSDLLQKLRTAQAAADDALKRLADVQKIAKDAESQLSAARYVIGSKFGASVFDGQCSLNSNAAVMKTTVEIRGKYALITKHLSYCSGISGLGWTMGTEVPLNTLNSTDGTFILRE